MTKIAVIIPAFNEARSIGQVVAALPKKVDQIIVADNASTDATAKIAREHGAVVVHEKKKGYGYACLKGMAFLEDDPPEIVVFLDGDYSDYPEDLETLVDPILKEAVVFSLGARDKKLRERGALTPQQVFGNGLACFLMRWLYKSRFTDLGPFRAIRWETLQSLEMQDKTYGWTVEMQLKILRRKLPYIEIPVRYRKRIGVSKVSGTVKGTLMAGYKIITWIGKFYFSKWK
ncbi:glycosyltransferase family 2 protein [Flavobacteriaceae bacterium]|jgi:glycosyltransferase involved in cell wall biosynthesis|nr:glycosyltransferase family 2 protein [Flavobacteriaceae bacterium]